MNNIGLLYTQGDSFSIKRSELLVGPMILEKVNFFRFAQNDIKDDLTINAQKFIDNRWQETKSIKLDFIMDYSIPKSKRVNNEKKLLESVPNIYRIDLDKYEILKLLEEQKEFKNVLLPCSNLSSYEDLEEAEKRWKKVAIKVKTQSNDSNIIIVSKQNSKWKIVKPYETYSLSVTQMKEYINKLKNKYYLQKYEHAVSNDNRSIAFSLVVQQRYDGAWRTPTVRGAISTNEEIASLSAGAEFIGTPLLGLEVDYFDYPSKSKAGKYMNLQLQKLAIAVCRKIEELIDKPLGALGIKLGFDENFNPKIFTIEPRTSSQSGPGRHLEFYKHLTQFSNNFNSKENENASKKKTTKKIENKLEKTPLNGVTFRSVINEKTTREIINKNYPWIDLSIGHGGRYLVDKITKSYHKPFLSFKIGNALSNRTKSEKLSISALDDYLGSGLVNYSETEFMRSVRLPLLQKQWEQISPFREETILDVLFLDEIDLGLRGISKHQYQDELNKSINWLEQLCLDNEVKSWGISLFNPKSSISTNLLSLLKEMKKDWNYFKFVSIKLKQLDKKLIEDLIKMDLHVVILSDEIDIKDLEKESLSNVTLLNYMKNLK